MPLPSSPAAVEPVLSVRDLTTSFLVDGVWKPVIDGITFDVMLGETLAIVGESGSGKSVTSLSIMQLLAKGSSRIEGEVWLNGRNLLGLPSRDMRHVRGREMAMIYQEPMTSLNPIFTIGQQLVEALTCHGEMGPKAAREEAVRLLTKVRIPNPQSRLEDYPHQYSGGMRQRVMIAMALASRPKLLIADEPTTALDVTIQGQILDLIKTLQADEGMSVLFITHDMGVVAEIADRVVVMYRGKAIESGSTEEIFHRGQQLYTRALISAVPKLGAMTGEELPRRFPLVDIETGETGEVTPVADIVDRTAQPVLKVSNLTTRFPDSSGLFGRSTGAVHAVENVSFELFQGETLALVGESGCGKSTTGRSITRLVEPDRGDIIVNGVDMRSLGRSELRRRRRDIQMIFQDPFASLNPRRTVGVSIAEPYLEHGLGTKAQSREKVANLLQRVGLTPDMMGRYPHEFSGGQRQRICIARALALDPRIIVADESVSALDVSIKAQVCNLLVDLQQSLQLSYLFISHDMAVVERVSHRVAVMHLGEIVEIGPRGAVFGNPQHAYTKKLIAAVPVTDPSRRFERRSPEVEELKSPFRLNGYEPPRRTYREVGAGHIVRVD